MKKQVNKDSTSVFFGKINSYFEKHKKTFLWISLAIAALVSFLMFDVKASLSGDDCDYVINADKFCHNFIFPGFRGPLYPIVLSPFVLLFGVNLPLLKALSAIFILLSIWLLYKTFANKIQAVILVPALLLVSVCSYVFFYASYTYSEPFFMFVQALFIYFFARYFLNDNDVKYTLKRDWRKYLILGSIILAMGLTRSIGFGVVGAVVLYFIIKKRWLDMLYTICAVLVVFFAFQAFKSIVWPSAGSAYDIKFYLAKNFYNHNQGMEDLPGFCNRLVQNSSIYLSNFLCKFMGLLSASKEVVCAEVSPTWSLTFPDVLQLPPNSPISIMGPGTALFISILIYALFAICLVAVFKKNKSLLFVGLYVGVMNFASFIILQSYWRQDRLIMIYYPYIILFLLGGICYVLLKRRKIFFIYPVLIVIMLVGNLVQTQAKISDNIPILGKNIGGDNLAGLTPDWQNFIRMGQWVAKNVDKNDVVVSRKPSISYIYTGRQFLGISSVPSVLADSLPTVAEAGKQLLVMDLTKGRNDFFAPNVQFVVNGKVKIGQARSSLAAMYAVDTAVVAQLTSNLIAQNVAYTTDMEDFKKYCMASKTEVNIYSPDILLDKLKENDVKYILLPSLRANPSMANGNIVNTLNRYVEFISIKYPNRFFRVGRIGTTEICDLVEYSETGVPTTKIGR